MVTVIGAYVAPAGTVTVNEVAVAEVTVARILPKKTKFPAGLVLKLLPVMVTDAPNGADNGFMDVITGAVPGTYVNVPRDPVPDGFVIEMLPVNPNPIVAVIVVGDTIVKEEAAEPPNFTEVEPVKLEPVMVTRVPAGPEVGLKELMIGGVK